MQGVKDLKSRMIDSTYSNAADPNSMRDLGMTRNAEYTFQIPTKDQAPHDKPAYSKYMVPRGKPTNNTFYSFGGHSSMMGKPQDNEVVSMHLLSNSKHLQTNTRYPVREFNVPQVQKVMDYSKNVSENIFSPGCTGQDFHSMIPDQVHREDKQRQRNKSAQVRMHTYRGTTVGWFAYDPYTPTKQDRKRVDRVNSIKTELKNQTQRRQEAEVELGRVKQEMDRLKLQLSMKQ